MRFVTDTMFIGEGPAKAVETINKRELDGWEVKLITSVPGGFLVTFEQDKEDDEDTNHYGFGPMITITKNFASDPGLIPVNPNNSAWERE